MYHNNGIGILLAILSFASISLIIISSTSVSFDEGEKKGRDDAIIFCIENPKGCKTTYDYLKLQENQK